MPATLPWRYCGQGMFCQQNFRDTSSAQSAYHESQFYDCSKFQLTCQSIMTEVQKQRNGPLVILVLRKRRSELQVAWLSFYLYHTGDLISTPNRALGGNRIRDRLWRIRSPTR